MKGENPNEEYQNFSNINIHYHVATKTFPAQDSDTLRCYNNIILDLTTLNETKLIGRNNSTSNQI